MARSAESEASKPRLWYLVTSHDQDGRPVIRMDIIVDRAVAANCGDEVERNRLHLWYMAATNIRVPRRWGKEAKGLDIILDEDQKTLPDPDARPRGRPRKDRSVSLTTG